MTTARQLTLRYKRKEVMSKIFRVLLITGAITVAVSSPYFVLNALRGFLKYGFSGLNKKEKKQFSDIFSYLKRNGWIQITSDQKQIYISLTQEGKKHARQYQIDELTIASQKKWDKKWRILIFDIPEHARIKREALRGKLKQLGFTMIQKSAWVHPYPCKHELKMLKEFFGFTDYDYLYLETLALEPIAQLLKVRYKLV